MFNLAKAFAPHLTVSALLALFSPATAGPGDLLVSPVRVVFEDRARVAEVTLVNKGDKAANYRVSFENRRMKTDGSFEAIDAPGEGDLFADRLVRYAPRRVTLEPNQPQTLRLMLRKPADLQDGEYRSHLHFAAVPDAAGDSSVEAQNGNGDSISIKLTPVYGVTIPVIVRHGALTANAIIADPKISRRANGDAMVSLRLERAGEMSLYGDFSLHVAGEEEPVMRKRGLALYTPNAYREVTMDVPAEILAKIGARPIEVRFEDRTQSGEGIVTAAAVRRE